MREIEKRQRPDYLSKGASRRLQESVEKGGIALYGGSTFKPDSKIREVMRPLEIVNRSFSGALITQLDYRIDDLLVPCAPKAVVIHAGAIELEEVYGRTAESVFVEFRQLLNNTHSKLPDAHLFVNETRPTILHWDCWPHVSQMNSMLRKYVEAQDWATFISVADELFDSDGKPNLRYFLTDLVHYNGLGREIYFEPIRSSLEEAYGG